MSSQSLPNWPERIAGFLQYHPGPLTITDIAIHGLGLNRGSVSPTDKGHIAVLTERCGWRKHGRWGARTFTRPCPQLRAAT